MTAQTSSSLELPTLKPCPFCGGPAEMVDATRILGVWRVSHRCRVIGFLGVDSSSKDDAAATWNTRAVPTDGGSDASV